MCSCSLLTQRGSERPWTVKTCLWLTLKGEDVTYTFQSHQWCRLLTGKNAKGRGAPLPQLCRPPCAPLCPGVPVAPQALLKFTCCTEICVLLIVKTILKSHFPLIKYSSVPQMCAWIRCHTLFWFPAEALRQQENYLIEAYCLQGLRTTLCIGITHMTYSETFE